MQPRFVGIFSNQIDSIPTHHQKLSQSGWQSVQLQALHHIVNLHHHERGSIWHLNCSTGEYITATIGEQFSEQEQPV